MKNKFGLAILATLLGSATGALSADISLNVSTNQKVNTAPSHALNYSSGPLVGMADSGDFSVSWSQTTTNLQSWLVFKRAYTALGTAKDTDQTRVFPDCNTTHYRGKLDIAPDGTTLFVFNEWRDVTGSGGYANEIWGRRATNAGTAFVTNAFQIKSGLVTSGWWYASLALYRGGIYSNQYQTVYQEYFSIHSQWRNQSDNVVLGHTQIHNYGWVLWPDVAVADSGHAVASHNEGHHGQGSNYNKVFLFNAASNTWTDKGSPLVTTDFDKRTHLYENHNLFRLAMNGDGKGVMVWRAAFAGVTNAKRSIVARRFMVTNNPTGNAILSYSDTNAWVVASSDADQMDPDVEINEHGNFAIAWCDGKITDQMPGNPPSLPVLTNSVYTATSNMFIRVFDWNLSSTSAVVQLNATGTVTRLPSVDINNYGAFVVVWHQRNAGTDTIMFTEDDRWDVYAANGEIVQTGGLIELSSFGILSLGLYAVFRRHSTRPTPFDRNS